jgi:hypothetical protein
MKDVLLMLLIVFAVAFALGWVTAQSLPDRSVYQLSKTPDGELLVRCLNGADATIRPSAVFGEITVSCGK